MAANVETMFYTREKPWHGLGTMVQEAPTSADALILAGLDWNVIQKPFATHAKPLRERANFRESLFAKTVDGNAMIDKAYELVKAA